MMDPIERMEAQIERNMDEYLLSDDRWKCSWCESIISFKDEDPFPATDSPASPPICGKCLDGHNEDIKKQKEEDLREYNSERLRSIHPLYERHED